MLSVIVALSVIVMLLVMSTVPVSRYVAAMLVCRALLGSFTRKAGFMALTGLACAVQSASGLGGRGRPRVTPVDKDRSVTLCTASFLTRMH
jgi:hypothetical protein